MNSLQSKGFFKEIILQDFPIILWHFGKKLQRYNRDKLSEFSIWEHKDNARKGLVFEQSIGPYLSIDETSLSHGELYTIVTNTANFKVFLFFSPKNALIINIM